MNQNKNKNILIIVLVLLIAGNIFFFSKFLGVKKEFRKVQTELSFQQTNTKILDFEKLFIKEVLKSQNEVDFETRLKLETAVRDLNDKEILAQWQKFTDSKTESDAQREVKNLLEILANKIKTI